MSKKDFKGGLSTLLGDEPEAAKTEQPKKKKGRPVTQTKVVTKSSEEGTKEGETRATFIVRNDLLDKMKSITYWERILIKDAINTALEDYIKKYEKSKGDVTPAPKRGQ